MKHKLLSATRLREILSEQLLSSESALLLSAYVSLAGAEFILKLRKDKAPKTTLYMRGRANDFILGASSLDAVKMLVDAGIPLYFKDDLHAKISIFDGGVALIGSANLTRNGLHYPSNRGNFELSTEVIISQEERMQLKQELADAALITPKLITVLQEQYKIMDELLPQQATLNQQATTWNRLIQEHTQTIEIERLIQHRSLTLDDLPHCNPHTLKNATEAQIEHDRALFGLTLHKRLQKEYFERSLLYHLLIALLRKKPTGEIFFGEVTQAVEAALTNPPPRRELKCYIQNLYACLDLIETEIIGVDRPNYSQRIFLRG